MKVQIVDGSGGVIWSRGREDQSFFTSRAYAQDGTLSEIISALEDALEQAKGELLTWHDSDVVLNTGATSGA